MSNRRVVVTGQGVISSLGLTADAHVTALREGKCGIGAIELIPTENLTIKIAAEAKAFKGEDYFGRSEIALRDRVTQMATVAAKEAIAQSGAVFDGALGERTATILGTSMGGQQTQDENYRLVYGEGKTRVHPFIVPRLMANAPVSWVSMDHGLKGPAYSISTACASSNHAIGQAFHLIRSGGADAAVTGGTESGLTWGVLKGWEGLRVMSKTACRPFSKTRDGMVQGEGAAILVLEELERAKERGADILGEIVGFGSSADAGDIVQPSLDGATRAMRAALSDGSVDPTKIAYVNAHGTATAMNDRTECAALRDVFGSHADSLSVSSTKSAHGHCIGAAGALEMVATLSALGGTVPPTIGYEEPDPDCDLNVVPNDAQTRDVPYAMSNSFAFGGLNAVVVVKRWDGN